MKKDSDAAFLLAARITQPPSCNWKPIAAAPGQRPEGNMLVIETADFETRRPVSIQERPFVLRYQGTVDHVHRSRAWDKISQCLPSDAERFKYMVSLFATGSAGYSHLKRRDRYRLTVFSYANGISPHLLREWLWVAGLLQTASRNDTLKRWRHVEQLFIDCEKNEIDNKFTTWDMHACCHTAGSLFVNGVRLAPKRRCSCKYQGRTVYVATGRIKAKRPPMPGHGEPICLGTEVGVS
jgi:hypothetical protein